MITGIDFVQQFVEDVANYADYKSVATQLGRECEELWRQQGIKAIVTSRAKDKDRLREDF